MEDTDHLKRRVDFHLEKLNRGESEAAFFGLIEAGHAAMPLLIEAFHKEQSGGSRAELVNIIWNYRQPEAIDFLREALHDSDAQVWKSALDGLVTLASPEVLQIFQAELNRELTNKKETEEFHRWINEAILQVQETILGSSGATRD